MPAPVRSGRGACARPRPKSNDQSRAGNVRWRSTHGPAAWADGAARRVTANAKTPAASAQASGVARVRAVNGRRVSIAPSILRYARRTMTIVVRNRSVDARALGAAGARAIDGAFED